jgi:hypothetical protein
VKLSRPVPLPWLIVASLVLATQAMFAVDVKIQSSERFDFSKVRTWGWHPDGPGEVKMGRTQDDDPEAMRRRAEPIIVDSVTMEMGRRGLQAAPASPDLLVHYYLLLTTSMSAQTLGQFLPTVVDWGLPPFAPATQSLEIMNQGSLVLDLSSNGTVVWRGVAQAKLKMDADEKRRTSLLRESVRDLLRRYPPKS